MEKAQYYPQFIYTLSCPIEGDIIYIGQTWSPTSRYFAHCQTKNKSRISDKIQQIKHFGLKPILTVIDEVKPTESLFWEVHYIWLYKSWGFNLLNKHTKYKKAII